VKFASVTESYNTTTAAGKLNLHILLSFGQFEREQAGERIRDKILASRKRGIFMGGPVPLGYAVRNRKLEIVEDEARIVRVVFEGFLKMGSATKLAQEIASQGLSTRKGRPIDKGVMYKMLNNKVYVGLAVHKGIAYPGEHEPIVSQKLWDRVHEILSVSSHQRGNHTRRQTPALLKGLIFGPEGNAMSPTHTKKGSKLYRYYANQTVIKRGAGSSPLSRVPAGTVESAVLDKMRQMLQAPEIVVGVWRLAQRKLKRLAERDVRESLRLLDLLWGQLFFDEQARIFQLIVDRVDVGLDGLKIRLRNDGIFNVMGELQTATGSAA
jgi:hypothetical protein